MAVVALTTTVTIIPTRCQQRKTKRRERQRGTKKKGNKKMKMKNNKKGGPCDQVRGFPFMLFEHLQTPRTWPYLGSTSKGVVHEK
jgi:hypothetical protein